MEMPLYFQYLNPLIQMFMTLLNVCLLVKIKKNIGGIVVVTAVAIFCAVITPVCLHTLGYRNTAAFVMFIVVIPCMVAVTIVSSFGLVKALFLICIQALFSYQFTIVLPQIIFRISGGSYILFLVTVFLSLGVEFVLLLKYRKKIHNLLVNSHLRWSMMTLVSLGFTAIVPMVFYLGGATSFESSYRVLATCSALFVIFMLVYVVFIQNFLKNEAFYREKLQHQYVKIQLDSLKKNAQLLQNNESQITIFRHDIKHKLNILTALIAKDEKQRALDFIRYHNQVLDGIKNFVYSSNVLLNSVLNYYFSLAEENGITVKSECILGDNFTVKDEEFAIVLANLLDNAIKANLQVPIEQRQISFICKNSGQIVFELANPCTQNVIFDDDGLPVSTEKEHGIGTKSVVSFCKKYGAIIQFTKEDSVFRVRFAL